MVGKIAKCMHGKIGIITGKSSKLLGRDYDYETDRYEYDYEYFYVGFTFDGRPWQSKKPIVIADSVKEYIQNNIEEFLPLAEPKEIGSIT